MNDKELHEVFVNRLKASMDGVAAVAAHYIRQCRYTVHVPALLIPATREEGVPDEGDLVVTPLGGTPRILDVKTVHYEMEEILRWPVIGFGAKSAQDKKTYKPDFLFIVSDDLHRCLVFDMSKDPPITIVKVKDQERGLIVETCAVHKSNAMSYDLDRVTR